MPLVDDRDNFVFATQGRAGTPDGNVFIDTSDPANPRIEMLADDEVTEVDFGAGPVPNPLSRFDGFTMQALYGALGDYRRNDVNARRFLRQIEGVFRQAGSYDLIANAQYAENHASGVPDTALVRQSGFRYLAANGQVNRIYFGAGSLNPITPGSITTYQTEVGGPVTEFTRTGDINEVVQVFGTTANGDTGAGDFDTRDFFAVTVRQFGSIHQRRTLTDSGIPQSDNFFGAFGLGETPHPTSAAFDETVINDAAVAPWSGLDYATETGPITRTGFTQADGDFTERIANPDGATLDEIVAFLDALARRDTDIDSGAPTQIGSQVDTLYTFDNAGNIVFKPGLFVENIPTADQTRLVFTDDQGDTKTYPVSVEIRSAFSTAALADPNAWYHVFIEDDADADDYNTANAITFQDREGIDQFGLVSSVPGGVLSVSHNFSAAVAGSDIGANSPFAVRVLVGGDPDSAGGPVENFAVGTIDGTAAVVNIPVSNAIEQNV